MGARDCITLEARVKGRVLPPRPEEVVLDVVDGSQGSMDGRLDGEIDGSYLHGLFREGRKGSCS